MGILTQGNPYGNLSFTPIEPYKVCGKQVAFDTIDVEKGNLEQIVQQVLAIATMHARIGQRIDQNDLHNVMSRVMVKTKESSGYMNDRIVHALTLVGVAVNIGFGAYFLKELGADSLRKLGSGLSEMTDAFVRRMTFIQNLSSGAAAIPDKIGQMLNQYDQSKKHTLDALTRMDEQLQQRISELRSKKGQDSDAILKKLEQVAETVHRAMQSAISGQ